MPYLRIFLLALLALVSTITYGNYPCSPSLLEKLPVLADGRIKPLHVHSSETLMDLTGKSSLPNSKPSEAFCHLSLGQLEQVSPLEMKIEHGEFREILGLQSKNIRYKDALYKMENVRAKYMSIQEESSLKKAMGKFLQRLQIYQKLTTGQMWTLPLFDEPINWVSITEFLNHQKLSKDQFSESLAKMQAQYVEEVGDNYLLELTYYKWSPFTWAMLPLFLALFSLVLFKKENLGRIFVVVTLLIQIIGIIMRIMISERAPITNMYETVLFSGFGCLAIAFIISFFRKEKIFLLAGLGYNLLCLLMMKFANNMLDSSISPLVPVLRDNFWLSTHVTTIILSYAALALSWMLSNMILFKRSMGKISQENWKYYSDLIYTSIKVGVVLLTAGVILGGVWADYSWGRFWGWDPKETWSLIVLLIYMAILHGKHTNWISPRKFVPLTAAAFMTVMMAWFGVNYILAAGLHSYGFSEGGALFLASFFLIQISLLIFYTIKLNEKTV